MNWLKLAEVILDEERSIKFLHERDLFPNTKICSNGHETKIVTNAGIRAGTWFEGSKIPFRTVVMLINCCFHVYTSFGFCKNELKMNHNTTVDWCNYLRKVCQFKEKGYQTKIDGEDATRNTGETRSMMKEAESSWRQKIEIMHLKHCYLTLNFFIVEIGKVKKFFYL
uniref:Transposase n=1 Tax=Strongyloides venezuelensis TaxID=75913 RepID=A0A0K0FVE3_STRVS